MTNTPQQPPAGWYPDPAGSGGERFWDGGAWSQSTRDKAGPSPAPQTAQGYAPPPASSQQGGQPQYGQPQYGQQQYGQQQGYGYAGGYTTSNLPRPAGFWWRVLGYLLDSLVILIPNWLLGAATGLTDRVAGATEVWLRDFLIALENPNAPIPELPQSFNDAVLLLSVLQVLVWVVYRIVMYKLKSATLGQLAIGARLVPASDQDAPLSWTHIIVRAIASPVLYALSFLGFVNGIFAAFTPRKQTIADFIARTVVLKIR